MWHLVNNDEAEEAGDDSTKYTETLALADYLDDLQFVSPIQVYSQNKCDLPRMEVLVGNSRVTKLKDLDKKLRTSALSLEKKFVVHQLCTQASLAYPCEQAMKTLVPDNVYLGSGDSPHLVVIDGDMTTVKIRKMFRLFELCHEGSQTLQYLLVEVTVGLDAETCDVVYTFVDP